MATFDEMAPWEAMAWFDAPIERQITGTGVGTQLCKADPRRVLLIVSGSGGVSAPAITTDPLTPTNKGMGLSSSGSVVVLNIEWFGPLVGAAWYSNLPIGSMITVFEVLLRDWPIPDKHWWERYVNAAPK